MCTSQTQVPGGMLLDVSIPYLKRWNTTNLDAWQ